MWTAADRERYGRDGLRYPSDLTDGEWVLIAPLIRPAKRGGRRRSVAVREVMNGMLYVLETGCQWPAPAPRPAAAQHGARLPAALGLGRHAGGRAPPALRRLPRAGRQRGEPHGRHPRQQVGQGGGKGGPSTDPVGFDAGKGVKGVKYHVLVDTLGLLLKVVVHAASIQDRDGAALVLDRRTRALFPFVLAIFADAGYRGPRAATARAHV